jgi:hypothetical protein
VVASDSIFNALEKFSNPFGVIEPRCFQAIRSSA